MGNLANSEDPDKMQHYAAFYWGLHCLLRFKQSAGKKYTGNHNLENSIFRPLKVQLFYTYCLLCL